MERRKERLIKAQMLATKNIFLKKNNNKYYKSHGLDFKKF